VDLPFSTNDEVGVIIIANETIFVIIDDNNHKGMGQTT
jgi:hypothetical protein